MENDDDWQKRILGIRARIAYLRTCIEGAERPYQSSTPQPQTSQRNDSVEKQMQHVERSEEVKKREARNNEMNDLRNKLRKKSK